MAFHAELSGSASHRWMRCPGSVRMIAAVVGDGHAESSPYAREGIFAHAVAAHILTEHKIPSAGSEFLFMDHDVEVVGEVTDEMLEHVMIYVDHVRQHGKTGVVKIEQHVDLSPLVRDNMWGTSDAIISKAGELVVCDFKYGYYPVRIIDLDLLLDDSVGELGHVNSQLLYYAAGAAHKYEWRHPVVVLEIVQPRCMEVPTIQSTTVTREQLKHWAEIDLYRAAHLATSDDPPLVAGEWCRFCPAMPACPEARKAAQNLAMADFADLDLKPPEVPDNVIHLMEILRWAPIVDAWLRACESAALQLMERGVRIPGFKLVEKRANRKWPDDLSSEEIHKRLKAAGGRGQLKQFLETQFISPAKAEKIAGKNAVNEVCLHPRGELTVAAESDRREAVTVTTKNDFEEFAS